MAAFGEQASTLTPPPEAAVAAVQVAQQQDGFTDTLPAQTSGGASESTAEVSVSDQAQQPQFVMTQPQCVLPAAANPHDASTTNPQMPQPVLGQVPQAPQMRNVTTAQPHVTQAQSAATTAALQQVLLAPTAAYQPAAVGSLQQTYVATPTATAAVDSQQPQTIQMQTSGFVSVAQPQLQLQAQVPLGSALPTPQQTQPPLRSASLPVQPSQSAQQQQAAPMAPGPPTLLGLQQAGAGAAVASVPVLQAQLQQLVLQPASGMTGEPSIVPQQQPAPPPQAQQAQQAQQTQQAQQQQQPAALLVPGQAMPLVQQAVAANQMVPGGLPLVPAMVPAHQVASTPGLPQSTPLLVSLPAATHPVQLVPSQGIVHVAPIAGLTPLAHVPTQAGRSPKKATESELKEASAGLPILQAMTRDEAKPPSPFVSDEVSPPSLTTPAPSEASFATASTTSTCGSASLKSSTTSSSDTAKAIEAVRRALGAGEKEGLTLDQLAKRAESAQS